MFFILKLVLIILLNKTYAYLTQDSEIILLPSWNSTNAKEISLTLKVFGKSIHLNLHRNDEIVSPAFKAWKYDIIEKLPQLKASDLCYYNHEDHISSAVINFCDKRGLEGLIFFKNDTLKIRPLRNDFASLSLIDNFCVREQINLSFGKSHLIKRLQYADSNSYHLNNFKRKPRHVKNGQEKLTIKLAVFLDEAAYRNIKPFLDEDDEKLRIIILTYVNRIQAVYHHPSLGVSIDILLVHLDIMKKQPIDLPVFNKNSTKMLLSFCTYANTRNPPSDNDWDISLYLTGITYSEDKYILGKSFNNGTCNSKKSCAIVKFGTSDYILTMGFTSSLIAAHEIGHLLGIPHDTTCEKFSARKYLMSSSMGWQDQTTWSVCSRYEAESLWHSKPCLRDHTKPKSLDAHMLDDLDLDPLDHYSHYHDLPGRKWTAKAQCELFFRDKDANVVTLLDICNTLQCETPHKNKSYFMGAALEGTHCAFEKECRGGECVPLIAPPYNFKRCRKDNWSEWKEDSCKSSCLMKSKGSVVKRRFCKHRTHRTANCVEPYYDVVLCDDSLLCAKKRETIFEFATKKCIEVRKILGNVIFELDNNPGWQVAHEVDRPWIACTLFCRKNDSTPYTPRLEMIDFGEDPYFPDGTWCHIEDGQHYYCRQHRCLPESYS